MNDTHGTGRCGRAACLLLGPLLFVGCTVAPSVVPDSGPSAGFDGGSSPAMDAEVTPPPRDAGVLVDAGTDAPDSGEAQDAGPAPVEARSSGFGVSSGGGSAVSERYRAFVSVGAPAPTPSAQSAHYRVELGAPLGR